MGWKGLLKRVALEAAKTGGQVALNAGVSVVASHPVAGPILRSLARPDKPGEGADAGAALLREAASAYFSRQAMGELDALACAWADLLREEKESVVFDPKMNLSKDFELWEFLKSGRAQKLGIKNEPESQEVVDSMRALAVNVLQPIRDHFDRVVRINSCYRCPELNAKTPGSSKTSQHCKGEAVDVEVPGMSNRVLAEWIRDNLTFDQLILEEHTEGDPNSGWVHVSYCGHSYRRMVLTKLESDPAYYPGLLS